MLRVKIKRTMETKTLICMALVGDLYEASIYSLVEPGWRSKKSSCVIAMSSNLNFKST